MDTQIYIVILVISLITLFLSSGGKHSNWRKQKNCEEIAEELNRCICDYNLLLSKFDVCSKKSQNTCTENEDLDSLNKLAELFETFYTQSQDVSDSIEDGRKFAVKGKVPPTFFYMLPNGMIEMGLTIKETKRVGINSFDYTRQRVEYEGKRQDQDTSEHIQNKDFDFFSGCDDLNSLNKRYWTIFLENTTINVEGRCTVT